jgi:hypothetical protein
MSKFFTKDDENTFRVIFTAELANAMAICRTTVASQGEHPPATVDELAAIAGPTTLNAFALVLGHRIGKTIEAAIAAEPPRNLGATGNFPRGKLDADDEGELTLAISCQDRTVRIDFGKPTAWIGLDRDSATKFADALMKNVERIR